MIEPVKIGVALDCDYTVFSAMSAAEKEEDWGDDIWTLQCDHKDARRRLNDTHKSILKAIEIELKKTNKKPFELVPICVLSGVGNWRKDVLETYKANRKGKRKPVGYPDFCQSLKDYFQSLNGQVFQWDGVEGDDVIGILMTKPELAGCKLVIGASCDKDFKTIPGLFFWMTEWTLLRHTEAEANNWHMYQTVMGDTTDGYGGIPGAGKVSGQEYLDNPQMYVSEPYTITRGKRKGEEDIRWIARDMEEGETEWDCLVSFAAKQGMSEEDLIVQAQVARILRASDWDFENSKPILWQPTKA